MQGFFNFVVKAARYLGGIVFHQSVIKQVFLVFMMTVSLSRAIDLENKAIIRAVCNNSTMHLNVNFNNMFQGSVYQSRNRFNPKCSYTVPINMNMTEVKLSMKFRNCGIKIKFLKNKIFASTEIVIQMHNLLASIYDKAARVSCEVINFSEQKTVNYNPFSAKGLDRSWIDIIKGRFLFGAVGEIIEAAMFLVINVRDDGSSSDMRVQNCILHSDSIITNKTNIIQLSNFYGCQDTSTIISNFTVVRPVDEQDTMFAFAPIPDLSFISYGRYLVTCGITICENFCPDNCNDTDSPVQLPLSDYVTQNIVIRNDGIVMPNSLLQLRGHEIMINPDNITQIINLLIYQWPQLGIKL